jgi:mRNA-degrading endonuclease RelE of RelBE toxin-antitoxin system
MHSARRGDFRVIYQIDDHERIVTIVAIDHRSDVYRSR